MIKTSTRTTVYLPVIGLVDWEKLKPGELVGVNKDSFLVLLSRSGVGTVACRVRQSREIYGTGRKTDRRIHRHRRFGQANRRTPRSHRSTHHPQTPVRVDRNQASQRRAFIRAAGDWQNDDGSCLRRANQSHVPQTGGSAARADVHRRRRQNGQRRFRTRPGKSAHNHLHRRTRRHRNQEIRLG